MKERINVTIDEMVLEKARNMGLNLSGEIEYALKRRLGGTSTTIPDEDPDKCQKCGKAETRATRNDPVGLTWLSPDDIWICDKCLEIEIREVVVSLGTPKKLSKEKRAEIRQLARDFVNIPEINKDILNQAKTQLR